MDFEQIFEKRENIGKMRHVGSSNHATLRDTIKIGLDDAFISLEEAISDLTNEDLWAIPIKGKNNIAWIVMHVLGNMDYTVHVMLTGDTLEVSYGGRWGYGSKRPDASESFPEKEELMKLVAKYREAIFNDLESITDKELVELRAGNKTGWKKTVLDSFNRIIFHSMSHLRQIWLLRGALGKRDRYPHQHWA